MKMHVVREIMIECSARKVFNVLADLGKWNIWSPWVHIEPTAKTVLRGEANHLGQHQTWEGEIIGTGEMTIEGLMQDQQVKMKIEFMKPHKSVGIVTFDLQKKSADQTLLTWTMESEIPFFLFFFKNMMQAFIGSDFSRGLGMLKEFVETGSVPARSSFQGEKDQPEFVVIGKKTSCSISAMSKNIRSDYENLEMLVQKGDLVQPEFIVTLYHKHDIPKDLTEYTAGYAYKVGQKFNVPLGFQMTQITNHKGMMIDHFGPYRHIGNAWSMATAYQRGKKKKLNKRVPMYEVYKVMPGGAEKDIYTQIVMPIR